MSRWHPLCWIPTGGYPCSDYSLARSPAAWPAITGATPFGTTCRTVPPISASEPRTAWARSASALAARWTELARASTPPSARAKSGSERRTRLRGASEGRRRNSVPATIRDAEKDHPAAASTTSSRGRRYPCGVRPPPAPGRSRLSLRRAVSTERRACGSSRRFSRLRRGAGGDPSGRLHSFPPDRLQPPGIPGPVATAVPASARLV